jgi:hypothetical protein
VKKIIALALVVVLALSLAACGGDSTPEDQVGAYFSVFENLYAADPGLNTDSKYLVLDLTKVKLADTEPLILLMQNFCDESGYILMLDTIDGLKEKGYVIDLGFPEGFVITFDDVRLENKTLVTEAMKWRSGDGAIGAEYTVKLKNGTWEITKTDKSWIS